MQFSILELASDLAELRTQHDWEQAERAESFYVEQDNGDLLLNADAQEIFNDYLDYYEETLKKLIKDGPS